MGGECVFYLFEAAGILQLPGSLVTAVVVCLLRNPVHLGHNCRSTAAAA